MLFYLSYLKTTVCCQKNGEQVAKGPASTEELFQGDVPDTTEAPNLTLSMTKGTNLKQLLPDVAFQEVLDKLGVFCPVMCFLGPFLQELGEVSHPVEMEGVRTRTCACVN